MQQRTRKRVWVRLAEILLWVGVVCLVACGGGGSSSLSDDSSGNGTDVYDSGTLGDLVDIGDFDNDDDRLRETLALAMDENGNLVGQADNGDLSEAAFLWESATEEMIYLGIHNEAYVGNSNYAYTYENYYGLSEEDDSGTSFTASTAVAVYSDGDTIAVIGNSATEDGEKRAFYWQDNTFVDLPPMYYTIDFDIVDDDGNETTYEGYVVKSNSEAIAMNGTYILINLEDEDGTHAYYWDKQSYTTIKVYDEKYEDYDDVDGDSDDDNDDDDDDVDAEPDSVEISVPDYQLIGNETSDDSEAVAINDANQAIVNVGDGDRVIVYDIDNANSETLEPLSGADDIYAVAINDDGNIAGTSGDDAFFWKNGNMTLCGNLCDDQADGVSVATAINNDNQVVGYATNDDGDYHAFVWQYEDGEAVITDLDTLGGDNSYAVAINDNGVVIGYSETGETYETGSKTYNIYHACAWYDGAVYDLGVMESDDADFIFSVGVAINDSDRIAGNSYTINDFTRGFVIDATFP